MRELLYFLIEEKYCNTETEALKILESVSDNFYNYLLEEVSASQRVGAMRKRMEGLISSLMKDPSNTTLQRQIKTIRSELPGQEKISRAERTIKQIQGDRGIASTPRGADGGRAQTSDIATTKTAEKRKDRPMTGAKINDPRVASAAGRETSRITRTSAEVGRAGGASSQFTGVRKTGKYSNMQSGGRATAALPNTGRSRTGSRFPEQRG
jgi:hypothetical protein